MEAARAMRAMSGDDLNRVSGEIVAAGIEVHRAVGPGLLESVYEACLCRELQLRGVPFERQVPVPVVYKGTPIDASALRLDIVVGSCVIVELKCVERVLKVHEAQLLSYLRLSNLRVGLLLNFNVPVMKEGIHRVVNNL